MRNKYLFLLLVLGLYCCNPPKYVTKSQSEIIKLDLDKSIINYIPLTNDDLRTSVILDTSYQLIKNKKYSKLKNYINSLELSGVHSSDMYLSRTLLFITKKDYLIALQSLRKINGTDYVLLKRLLSIDLTYELARANNGTDYFMFLKDYQELIDAFPDDISLKKIVAIRLRYLRYNY